LIELFCPTQQTKALPVPLTTLLPENTNGSAFGFLPSKTFLFTAQDSCSAALSSTLVQTFKSELSSRRQSVGTLEPVSRRIMSPTTRVHTLTL